MRTIRRFVAGIGLAGLALSASVFVATAPAGAVTFDVTTGADSGGGSYRQAIIDAGTAVEPVIIDFDPGLTVQLTSDVIYTGTQPLELRGNGSTIDGGGAQVLGNGVDLTVDALNVRNAEANIGGAFQGANIVITNSTFTDSEASIGGAVSGVGTVDIADSTFTGNDANIGGGVSVIGDLVVARSTFTGNESFIGGAISVVNGTTSVTQSVFTDNDAPDGAGGAISGSTSDVAITDTVITGGDAAAGGAISAAENTTVIAGATALSAEPGALAAGDVRLEGDDVGATQFEPSVTLVQTTLADDVATVGGGVVATQALTVTDGAVSTTGVGTLTATNSTFTGDSASERGGALALSEGAVTLVYVTAADNGAPSGAQVGAATLDAFGTVFGPSDGPACDVGSTTSHGYNRGTDATCGLTSPTDQEGVGDPLLGPLGDNGGPTPTRVPQPGSLLLDAIPAAACQDDGASGVTTDQRGVARPQVGGCDIGAVEVEPVAIVLQPTFTG